MGVIDNAIRGLFRESDGDERRRGGRLPMEAVTSSLGKVDDLSVGGARIRRRRRGPGVGAELVVKLFSQSDVLKVRAKVVRQGKDAFGPFVALQFLDPTPEQRQRLCHLAQCGRSKRVIYDAA